jgi:hypothetical protein
VVYVVDRSGSMGAHGQLVVARHELQASLNRLAPEVRFQVVAYNRGAETLGGTNELLPATEENKHRAVRFLESLAAEGGTDHGLALHRALLFQPDVIYFLTDADDLNSEQVHALTRLNHGRAAIHAIELNGTNRDRADMPLHVLARENGGRYQAVVIDGGIH